MLLTTCHSTPHHLPEWVSPSSITHLAFDKYAHHFVQYISPCTIHTNVLYSTLHPVKFFLFCTVLFIRLYNTFHYLTLYSFSQHLVHSRKNNLYMCELYVYNLCERIGSNAAFFCVFGMPESKIIDDLINCQWLTLVSVSKKLLNILN